MSEIPQLGAYVNAIAVIEQKRDRSNGQIVSYWERSAKSIKGVFMGVRYKKYGKVVAQPTKESGWHDPHEMFVADGTIEAWMIVTSPYHKPVFILPDDVIGVAEQ